MDREMYDVIIVGAGPVGLACAIEAKRQNLTSLILEKGALVNSFLGYPNQMEFFSTPELMEIGNHPFPTLAYKPTREEGIEYYRRVASAERLQINLYEAVKDVHGEDGSFTVTTTRNAYSCRKVIVATGFFDVPNRLNIPGEDLTKVTHYFKEPFPYAGQKVVVVGGKNSAAKAALSCYRHGAEVTLVVRGGELSDSIKYWLKPDLQNRIAEGSIACYYHTAITEIREDEVDLQTPEGRVSLPNDWVLAMTGYKPDYSFLTAIGIFPEDDENRTPRHDRLTFETDRGGIYLAGTVCGGLKTSTWFIENGRFHAEQIIQHIIDGTVRHKDLDQKKWKTSE